MVADACAMGAIYKMYYGRSILNEAGETLIGRDKITPPYSIDKISKISPYINTQQLLNNQRRQFTQMNNQIKTNNENYKNQMINRDRVQNFPKSENTLKIENNK